MLPTIGWKLDYWAYKDSKLKIKKLECEISKLDEFKLQPYFIKIDVQGYELEVLKGSINTIKANLPIFLIESVDAESMEFLKQFGYEFYYYSNGKFKLGNGSLNTFCITNDKLDSLISH